MKYMKILEKNNISPNFWCSEEYIEKAELKEEEMGGFVWMYDEEDPMVAVLPPISDVPSLGVLPIILEKSWSDVPEVPGYKGTKRVFLDYEFIYDPKRFLEMDGGRWATFRKNIRKFPSRYKNPLVYIPESEAVVWVGKEKLYEEVQDTVLSWLSRKEREIQDSDVFLKYIKEGERKWFLLDEKRRIVLGVNIWDSNYKYNNFRYSICKPLDYLSEYLRYRFYTSPPILGERYNFGKLVNDGGSLNNPSLERFKRKLQPVQVREVYTWTRSNK